jgi:hypothetical protein
MLLGKMDVTFPGDLWWNFFQKRAIKAWGWCSLGAMTAID